MHSSPAAVFVGCFFPSTEDFVYEGRSAGLFSIIGSLVPSILQGNKIPWRDMWVLNVEAQYSVQSAQFMVVQLQSESCLGRVLIQEEQGLPSSGQLPSGKRPVGDVCSRLAISDTIPYHTVT